jgi:hypothetical protein
MIKLRLNKAWVSPVRRSGNQQLPLSAEIKASITQHSFFQLELWFDQILRALSRVDDALFLISAFKNSSHPNLAGLRIDVLD